MRPYFSLVSLLFTVLFLSSCQHTMLNPQPMGRGYVSYNEPYKSAHGVDARSVGYEFSVEENQAIIEDMRFAAQDLVTKLDKEISFSMDQVYLDIPQTGVFYSSFDYVLRDEFTKHGYMLANAPEKALSVTLVAQDAEDLNSYKAHDGYRNLYLGLALDVVKGRAGTIVSGVYEEPVYDFKPTKVINVAAKDGEVCNKCEKGKKCSKCSKKETCSKTTAERVPENTAPVELKSGA